MNGRLAALIRIGIALGYAVAMVQPSPARAVAPAAAETVLWRFQDASHGVRPDGGLVRDASGTLYGATGHGGNALCPTATEYGCGAIYALVPPASGKTAWTETILYRFGGGADGATPAATLVFDGKGALYGTTLGADTDNDFGTVFQLLPPTAGRTAWTEKVLHGFYGGRDGAFPSGSLVFDSSGALYGTTAGGDSATDFGTVFKLTPPATGSGPWTETILYRFQGREDGASPQAAVVFDGSGALYGTTQKGGGTSRWGTVFKLTPPAKGGSAWTETVLYAFKGKGDGAFPESALVFDTTGTLYGTTEGGDDATDFGTVFKLAPPKSGGKAWAESVLLAFKGGDAGANPQAGLLLGADGALFGTTYGGDRPTDFGTIFRLTPPVAGSTKWAAATLYKFKGAGDGAYASAVLLGGSAGALFGTTRGFDRETDCGTVYEVTGTGYLPP
jgi:uncharacterized repeat protein (TIGR03803 family)